AAARRVDDQEDASFVIGQGFFLSADGPCGKGVDAHESLLLIFRRKRAGRGSAPCPTWSKPDKTYFRPFRPSSTRRKAASMWGCSSSSTVRRSSRSRSLETRPITGGFPRRS